MGTGVAIAGENLPGVSLQDARTLEEWATSVVNINGEFFLGSDGTGYYTIAEDAELNLLGTPSNTQTGLSVGFFDGVGSFDQDGGTVNFAEGVRLGIADGSIDKIGFGTLEAPSIEVDQLRLTEGALNVEVLGVPVLLLEGGQVDSDTITLGDASQSTVENTLVNVSTAINATGGTLTFGVGVDFSDSFWTENRSFAIALLESGGILTLGLVDLVGDSGYLPFGSFALSSDDESVYLDWTAIPEPQTYALIFSLSVVLLVAIRRVRQSRRA